MVPFVFAGYKNVTRKHCIYSRAKTQNSNKFIESEGFELKYPHKWGLWVWWGRCTFAA